MSRLLPSACSAPCHLNSCSDRAGVLSMHFSCPVLHFGLPVHNLFSRKPNGEEIVHHQTNPPANEGEEEPEELWNKHQVDDNQQDVDQHVNGSMDVKATSPLNRSQFSLCSLVVLKRDSLDHVVTSFLKRRNTSCVDVVWKRVRS